MCFQALLRKEPLHSRLLPLDSHSCLSLWDPFTPEEKEMEVWCAIEGYGSLVRYAGTCKKPHHGQLLPFECQMRALLSVRTFKKNVKHKRA